MRLPIGERVKRWDVYDVADELADVIPMLGGSPSTVADAHQVIRDLERRLWDAADIAGTVGPYPDYEQEAK